MKSFQLIEEHIASLELPVIEREVLIPEQKWQKLPTGLCSGNTDGSIDALNKLAGSRFVIRDDTGSFIQARYVRQKLIEDPFLSELLACLEGLEAAVRMGLERVIIQTDCSGLVTLWQDVRNIRMEGIHI